MAHSIIIQPTAAAGKDAIPDGTSPNTETGTSAYFAPGMDATDHRVCRGLMQFDLTSIPVAARVNSAILSLVESSVVNRAGTARVFSLYRVIRAWVEATVTWNKYDGTNPWQTAGAAGANDRESAAFATVSLPANPVAGTVVDITLDPVKVQEWVSGAFTNNGFIMQAATEDHDRHVFWSSDYAVDTTLCPKLTVLYDPDPYVPSGTRFAPTSGPVVRIGSQDWAVE